MYNYNNEVKEDKIGRQCSTNGVKMNAYMLLVRKQEGNRPLGRPRCRWVHIIKMGLGELMRCCGLD
jgi:hypothetical protein